ncbi:MAG: sugar phosphate isomerase/epimerase [Pirellulales bacterium]|nr:sugar phosphate isomerase/epimerase [Pirellulales bacterium]
MKYDVSLDRRAFLQSATAVAISMSAVPLCAAEAVANGKVIGKPKLRKAVKYSMIQEGHSPQAKLDLAKSLGFEGVEIDAPNHLDRDEVRKASEESGVHIHGTITAGQWKTRLSDPDPAVRAVGAKSLLAAIEDAGFYGADTVLLVPGQVTNKDTENFDQVWERSQAEVRKAIPAAEKANVKICIETVWNDFITKPQQLIDYVDQLNSPHIAAYFDISNMIKYGLPPAEWIRKLGKRIAKFDFKGYSKTKKWVAIGEGDEDWPEVLKALAEIGYDGWATSEVDGGGKKELEEISKRMDRVLGLG